MSLQNKTALIYDLGLFSETACRLAQDFGTVKYFVPWVEFYPQPFKATVGEGLEGLERVSSFWDEIDKADCIIVPDTTCWDVVEYLKAHDYPVAGAGKSEKLEQDRWYSRGIQVKNDLPVQETHKITGVSALRDFCKEHKDFYIKTNTFRGLCDSFHHVDLKQTEATIDYIAYKIGPWKEDIVFVCEEGIRGIEPGLDGITWDDELLYPTMGGYENKDRAQLERVYQTEADCPAAYKLIHEGLSPVFKENKTRFFYSTELRMDKDKVPFLIDPTIRFAGPCVMPVQLELITNFSEVLYGMATNEKVTPKIKDKYAAALSLTSFHAEDSWVNISFPKELRQHIKFHFGCRKGKDYYAVPGLEILCTVVATGNSVQDVVKTVKERAKQVEAKGIEHNCHKLDELVETVQEGKPLGINF